MLKDCARIDIGYICSTVLHVVPTLFCFIEQSDTTERTFIIPTLNYVTEIFPSFCKMVFVPSNRTHGIFYPIYFLNSFFYCFHLSFLNMFLFAIFIFSLFLFFFAFFLCISFLVFFFEFISLFYAMSFMSLDFLLPL